MRPDKETLNYGYRRSNKSEQQGTVEVVLLQVFKFILSPNMIIIQSASDVMLLL